MATWINMPITTTSTASSTLVWRVWCNSTTTATSTITLSADDAWGTWVSISDDGMLALPVEQPTQEELDERARVAAEVRQRHEARLREQRAAEERAEACLLENLAPEQRASWRDKGHFVVHGRRARYRIRKFAVGNVDVVGPDGFIRERLCVHSSGIPAADNILAQKLHLEANEDEVLRIANRHGNSNREQVLPRLN